MTKPHARFPRLSFGLAVCALLLRAFPGTAAEPRSVYDALRSARPTGKTLTASHLELERDAFRLRFDSGTFQFLEPVEGRTVAAVFVGAGSLELLPSSEGERRHLAFVTGEKGLETLRAPFETLVLLFTDGTAAEIEGRATAAPTPPPRAAEVYDAFRSWQQKDLRTNLQLRLLRDVLREPAPNAGVFLAYLPAGKYPAGLAAVDPTGLDWLAGKLLGSVAGESSAFQTTGENEGVWYCSPAKTEVRAGRLPAAQPVAHALHYAVETTIFRDAHVAGRATIQFVPLAPDPRVLPIHLMGRLRLKQAEIQTGESSWAPAAFVQEDEKEDSDAAVLFPSAIPRTGSFRIRLSYEGLDVLRNAGDGNFLVGARDSWYPNLGTFTDLASYELTYRFPKNFDIVSVGNLAAESVEGDNKVAVWKEDRPIRVAGFNYGKFRKLERADPDSGVTVNVYTNPGTPDFIHTLNALLARRSANRPVNVDAVNEFGGITTDEIGIAGSSSLATAGLGRVQVDPDSLADSALADGINTARIGKAFFGPLPENHVSITQQTQAFFGQSWPTLIYLPYIAALDGTTRREIGLKDAADFIEQVGPHEFAHQWWGHVVGWNGYRDQWLSEGFAEFTASLVIEAAGGAGKSAAFWEKARRWIVTKPQSAEVSNADVGPISDGLRLATKRNPWAYDAMVYAKGAYVLHMLRMQMRDLRAPHPDEKFIEILKDFTASYAGKNPTTRDFQTVVERHMIPALDSAGDGKMDWFFREWIDGTAIPHFRQKIDIAKAADGQYHFTGAITQEAVPADFRSTAHLYVEFAKGEVAHLGVMPLVGNMTAPLDVNLRLSKAPKRALLNARHEVLDRD